VVATPAVRRALWGGAAGTAAVLIAALALHGQRPEPGLVRFEPAGLMLHLPPERVAEVEVTAGAVWRRFVRTGPGAWAADGSAAAPPAGFSAALERALHLLNVSAPQRILEEAEIRGVPAADYGLDPPRLVVRVRAMSGERFTIAFGGLNHQALAQYVRVASRADVALLPRFVGEAWEAAAGMR
jgi:hypothetical protein